ncbi:hypothetical protein ANCDUO_20041 [Ancylostoma duodenale]|uniref:Uncharacterized protein n=1 Tax=Ancylostoma duodenale TaxID=51022 RepID=A0A0C2C0Y0_9BILA|nr:hypothetical protein ANCDUO_20041 [Ancylostoma duodenale]
MPGRTPAFSKHDASMCNSLDHSNIFKICSRECYGPSACVCEEGFFRDDFGNCVEEDECDDMEIVTFAPN